MAAVNEIITFPHHYLPSMYQISCVMQSYYSKTIDEKSLFNSSCLCWWWRLISLCSTVSYALFYFSFSGPLNMRWRIWPVLHSHFQIIPHPHLKCIRNSVMVIWYSLTGKQKLQGTTISSRNIPIDLCEMYDLTVATMAPCIHSQASLLCMASLF